MENTDSISKKSNDGLSIIFCHFLCIISKNDLREKSCEEEILNSLFL